MAEFGGWEMPIEYVGGGVVKEHTAVRTGVGIFDVSHLGKVVVRGPGAADYVNATLTNDLGRIGPGRAQYTLCCDDASGGVVDDLIAYLRDDTELILIPNAANAAEVVRRLRSDPPPGVAVEDRHRDYGILAVQGRSSHDVLGKLGLPASHDYMSFVEADWDGQPLIVCRTGYTGERGFELVVPASAAPALWKALLDAGAPHGILPCGLGARDTLRTEMGYPLHGQDLSLEITPVQARLGWAVGWSKPRFWGRDVLAAERAAGARRLLWGLESLDRSIPRPHMVVTTTDGTPVGEVTSGTFSPSLRKGIGLALLARGVGEGGGEHRGDRTVGVAEGDEVVVDVRGRPARMRVVKPPFLRPSVAAA